MVTRACNSKPVFVFYSLEICAARKEVGLKQLVGARLMAIGILLSVSCWAQQPVQVPRSDGAQIPLRVYSARVSGCAPLALVSPGAGGSEDGYKYLAQALQEDGWRAIVIGHRESGMHALRADMRESHGLRKDCENS